jgi:hypothetical protein
MKPPAIILIGLIILSIAIVVEWKIKAEAQDSTEVPLGHFKFENAALLSDEEAASIYERIAMDMAARYKLSHLPEIKNYRRGKSAVRNVYRATAHGNRYHNVFVNSLGKSYLNYLDAGTMPAGTLIFKDSFTVNKQGGVFPGTLAIMEKMPEGFNSRSGNWRFTMVMPDGSILGKLKGEGSAKVEFCVDCHMKSKQYDYLFFPPKEYRLKPAG